MEQLHLIRKVIVISHPVRAVGTTVVSWIDLVPAARTVSRHSRCSLSAIHLRCSLRRRSTPGGVGIATLQIVQVAIEKPHTGLVCFREVPGSPALDRSEAPRPQDHTAGNDDRQVERTRQVLSGVPTRFLFLLMTAGRGCSQPLPSHSKMRLGGWLARPEISFCRSQLRVSPKAISRAAHLARTG